MKEKGVSIIMTIFFISIFLMFATAINLSTQRKFYEIDLLSKKIVKDEVEESVLSILNKDTIYGNSEWFTVNTLPVYKSKVKNYIFINDKSFNYEMLFQNENLSKLYITVISTTNPVITVDNLNISLNKSLNNRYRSYVSNEFLEKNKKYILNINSNNKYIILVRAFY
ncbi:MAG: hypothetical protein GX287_02445 [Fusobacteria bacterium]|nr:hypothetical protein [Fusobacteriota bacterium]